MAATSSRTNVSTHTTKNDQNRRELIKQLQLAGFTTCHNALAVLEDEYAHQAVSNSKPIYNSVADFIDCLCHVVMRMSCVDCVMSKEVAEEAVQRMRQARKQEDPEVQSSEPSPPNNTILIKNVNTQGVAGRSSVPRTNFKHHYDQLSKALRKLPLFESGTFVLTGLDELNTYDSSIEYKCVVFALLRRNPLKIMDFMLEDPSGQVPATFSLDTTDWREPFTLMNGIYLIEGSYDGKADMFTIESIGLPPMIAETFREIKKRPSPDEDDPLVIILNNVHLDDPGTFEALKHLFTGYGQCDDVPQMFILIGNFTSSQSRNDEEMREHMKRLVLLISTQPSLVENSHFVLVPGPNDLSNLDTFVE